LTTFLEYNRLPAKRLLLSLLLFLNIFYIMKIGFFVTTAIILGVIVVVQFIIILGLRKKLRQWGIERYINFTTHID